MAEKSWYEQIRRDLLDGVFRPDAVILETQLSERYGVSRTPIREALGRLQQEGLIERLMRGYRVCSGTPADVLELYEVRTALEELAAAAAADRRTELALAKLEHLHAQAEQIGGASGRYQLDSEWHQALWRASGNSTLLADLERLTTRLRIYDRHEPQPEELDRTLGEHARILDAVRARDAAVARQVMAEHLNRSRALRLRSFASQEHGD